MPPGPRALQCCVLEISHTALDIQHPYCDTTSAQAGFSKNGSSHHSTYDYPGMWTSCHSPICTASPTWDASRRFNNFLFVNPQPQPLSHPTCRKKPFECLPRSYPLPPKYPFFVETIPSILESVSLQTLTNRIPFMVQRKLNSVRHPRIFWNFWRGKLAPRSQDKGSGAATLEPKIRNLPVLIGSFVTFKGQLTESARVKCPARRMNGVGFNWPEIDFITWLPYVHVDYGPSPSILLHIPIISFCCTSF